MTSTLAHVLSDAVARDDVAMLVDLAHTGRPDVALPAVEAAIALGDKVEDEYRFAGAVYQCLANHPGGLERVVDAFIRLAEPPEPAARALQHVLQAVAADGVDDGLYRRFWSWFERTAGPNQGEIITQLLMLGWPGLQAGGGVPVRLAPLVDWVLRNGTGLLRGSGEGTALRGLVVCADTLRPDLLVDAVTVLLVSRSRDEAVQCDGGVPDMLLPQVDRALARGLDDVLITDLLEESPQFRAMCGLPPHPSTAPEPAHVEVAVGAYPKLLEVVMATVASASDRKLHATLTSILKTKGCPDLVEVADQMASTGSSASDIVEELVRIAHANPAHSERRSLVEHLAIRRDTVDFVARAILVLSKEPGRLAADVAAQVSNLIGEGDPLLVAVALRLSLSAGVAAGPSSDAMRLDHVEELLTELMSLPRGDSLHPFIASLLSPGTRVRIADHCDNRDYATERLDGGWVSGSRGLYERFLRRPDRDEGMRCCALYFAHEMLHHAQGLADKKNVISLRRNGSEQFVLELDLCADMLAIEWVAALGRPGWTREALHDLTLRLFDEFPATASHIQPSVTRKSLRLLCHVLTYHLRPHGYGWAWLELPAIDGEATVWWSHPDSRRVASFTLTAGEVSAARTVARDGSLDDIKTTCVDWLARAKAKSGV